MSSFLLNQNWIGIEETRVVKFLLTDDASQYFRLLEYFRVPSDTAVPARSQRRWFFHSLAAFEHVMVYMTQHSTNALNCILVFSFICRISFTPDDGLRIGRNVE